MYQTSEEYSRLTLISSIGKGAFSSERHIRRKRCGRRGAGARGQSLYEDRKDSQAPFVQPRRLSSTRKETVRWWAPIGLPISAKTRRAVGQHLSPRCGSPRQPAQLPLPFVTARDRSPAAR